MQAILSQLVSRARITLGDLWLDDILLDILRRSGPHDALGEVLTRWSAKDTRPLVLLINEVDALVGDTLIAVLRQIRGGYDNRPDPFQAHMDSAQLKAILAATDGAIANFSVNEMGRIG
ncbi:MAG: hypothetical protein V2J55_20535 [Candidatus Competibacteraceae bacterium]|nr:hypothetical protein [Candidatus Competibacteraceae bacterium]